MTASKVRDTYVKSCDDEFVVTYEMKLARWNFQLRERSNQGYRRPFVLNWVIKFRNGGSTCSLYPAVEVADAWDRKGDLPWLRLLLGKQTQELVRHPGTQGVSHRRALRNNLFSRCKRGKFLILLPLWKIMF